MIRRTLSIALVASTLLLGCQSDQERAREILEQSHTSEGAPAREALTEATRLDPTLREAWSRLADVEGSESRWAEARAAVQRAIALSDDSAHDRETEARAAIELEDWSGAETSITRALALGSPEAPRRTQLGKVLEHLDRTDDALAAYRRAVELDAGQLEARLGVARLLVGRVRTILDAPEAPAEIAEFADIRGQLDAARPLAEGSPQAAEVASLAEDLEALETRSRDRFAVLGAGDTLGNSGLDALGGLIGDPIGDSFGFGGLGLSGIGQGGEPRGETIGLGSLGLMGHGSGTGGGSGQGMGMGGLGGRGSGMGLTGRTDPQSPDVNVTFTSSGGLDTATVRGVVTRQRGQLRYCYERALAASPALTGTVHLTAYVATSGSVSEANGSGVSDEVASCMSAALRRATFPEAASVTTITVDVACHPPAPAATP
jgi:Flp pilus assembly protein TadD